MYVAQVCGGEDIATIDVYEKMNKNITRKIGSKEFKMRMIPDPIPMVGSYPRGSMVSLSKILEQKEVKAVLPDFDYDIRFLVTGFTVSGTYKGFVEEAKSNSSYFTSEQKQLIRNLGSGSKLYIEDIQAKGPDGSIRMLNSLMFKLK